MFTELYLLGTPLKKSALVQASKTQLLIHPSLSQYLNTNY